jgi:hypothetical protein
MNVYNNCLKIHILKQQAADFRLVFNLMEIINFRSHMDFECYRECSIFEVNDFMMHI